MPRIPIFRLGRSAEQALPPQLGSYTPKLTLESLQLGVDNLRHDVHLSPKFVEQARLQIARLIVRHHRPVVLALAMGDGADEAVAPDIAAR